MISIAEHPTPGTWMLDLRATTPRALPDIRAWVVSCLPDFGEGHRDDVLLAATELVANAYVHGGGARLIQLWRGVTPCAVRIEVADVSVEQPRARRSQIEDSRGRGLLVVDGVAVQWGVRRESVRGGKIVWAHIRCDGGCPEALPRVRGRHFPN
ncbi:ATP-binding protein [Amycolatopsis sp. QT-25]|uniref:ATP-binding protein n=1 Tax=Amycolatopsis sp. QT-25 TaxID=3034022 RepID=UPI0023EC8806|nr:ATP-binding protein [Amycolatopsis sp. QT-25]WET77058.1 ATP-binding protein [Amycolatopsis sp. QT-25]